MIYLAISNLALVLGFIAFIRTERREHEEQIQLLLQRIQAPEIAVAQAIPDDPGERAYTLYDDDEDLAKELERLNGDG